jgi:branched-chain amino acid aminotransferase
MKQIICFSDNRFLPLKKAVLTVIDLGLQRGYGVFDFLRIANNVPLFLDDHLERFLFSAKEMRLLKNETGEKLKGIIATLLKENDLPDSGIRILLTGGPSPDGYQILDPNLIIIQQPITPPPDRIFQNGIKLVPYYHQRQLPHIKTTDYLMAVWLHPWITEKGADDILYHQNGIVSECPRSNFFIVTKEKKLVTPGRNILKGITRKILLTLAISNGMEVEERDLLMEEISNATEAFITSSTKRLIPVTQIDDIFYKTFNDGGITNQLYDLFLKKEKEIIGGH